MFSILHYCGCLYTEGAIGDAFGSAVEFLSIDAIVEKFGEVGINDLELGESGYAEIAPFLIITGSSR